MIDIASEQLVPLNEVPKLLPARGNGKRIHISAIYRWAQRGVRGTRLEVIRVGGTTYTSREALQRFASPPAEPVQYAKPKTATRDRQLESALQRLDGFLYGARARAGDKAAQHSAIDKA